MSSGYSEQELVAQLQLDLAEGESWHTEFKEYDHRRLDEKIADSWKNDLSDELAALGSINRWCCQVHAIEVSSKKKSVA